jgi:hypothetical protein
MMPSLISTWSVISTQFATSLGIFLPRLLGAVITFIVGLLLAKLLRRVLRQVLRAIQFSSLVNQAPIQLALENPEVGKKIEVGVINLIYWLVMLLVIHTTASVLGISSVMLVIEQVLGFLPQIFSAILILGFGILLAGMVESLVKGAVRGIGLSQAILLGKLSSYLVISIALLSSLSELGIARDFITILFIGFVTSLTLGIGLALGLGGKEIVGKLLNRWYSQTFDSADKPSKK